MSPSELSSCCFFYQFLAIISPNYSCSSYSWNDWSVRNFSFHNYYPLRNREFCETEDMILFYLLLKQNALRDLLLIGVFLILFNCISS